MSVAWLKISHHAHVVARNRTWRLAYMDTWEMGHGQQSKANTGKLSSLSLPRAWFGDGIIIRLDYSM